MRRDVYRQRTVGRTNVYATPADWRDISAALKSAFPAIRFVHEPSFKNIDRDEFERALQRVRPGWTEPRWGEPRETVAIEPQPSWQVRYCDTIEPDPDSGRPLYDGNSYTWIEPRHWKPIWGIDLSWRRPTIMNRPQSLYLMIRHGRSWMRKKGSSYEPICAQADTDIVYLGSCNWNGAYCPGEDAQRRNLWTVRRIFDRFTTNALARVDYETGKVISRDAKGGIERVGFHALEWARAHPGHRIGDDIGDRSYIKPIEWIGARGPLPSARTDGAKADEDVSDRLFVFGREHTIPPGKKRRR